MAILDKLPWIGTSRENKRLKEALNQKFYDSLGDGFNTGFDPGVSSLFMETFMAGFTGKNYNTDPRLMMETYKAIYNAFPVFVAALSVRKKAMGEPVLTSDDKGMQNDLDWLSANLPVTNWKNPYKLQRGLCSLKDRLYSGSVLKGTAFCQTKRDESMNPISVEIFRPEWFSVKKDENYNTQFIFNSRDKGQIVLLPDGDFQIYSQTVGDFDWGVPMAHGAEYFAWLALRKLENNNNFDARIASGSMMFLLSGSMVNPITGQIDKEIMEKMEGKKGKIRAAIDIMMKHANNTGRPSVLVDTLPIDGKLDAVPFGQGVAGPQNVPEIIGILMDQLLLKTETPGFLLNAGSAGGMNSDVYREQSAQFQGLVEGDREGIEPHLMQPAIAWLIANGASPKTIKSLKAEWNAPNTQDLKVKADTALVDAQAYSQMLLNLSDIVNATGGGSSVLLRQYLESIGWDEAIAAELDFSVTDDEGGDKPKPGQA